VTGNVLLLAPSRGLGGGIERYVSTIEAALDSHDLAYQRIDLVGTGRPGGLRGKLDFIREVHSAVRHGRGPTRLIFAHPNLLPVLRVLNVAGQRRRIAHAAVILHGIELWAQRRPRGWRLMRRGGVRVITVSNFSAGALVGVCPANVLQPGVSPTWFQTLVDAADRARPGTDEIHLVTAFRPQDWRDKGLDTLLDAVALLGDDRVRLTVCGAGPVPADLSAAIAARPRCRFAANLSDAGLADELAAADLFVLATRTRFGRDAYGEGFGLVLIEAQLAGTPVVAPAYGGSGDAFQPGLTGLAPVDESPEALAQVLGALLTDPQRLTDMGHAAATWSRARFAPAGYATQAVQTLLGRSARPARRPGATAEHRALHSTSARS